MRTWGEGRFWETIVDMTAKLYEDPWRRDSFHMTEGPLRFMKGMASPLFLMALSFAAHLFSIWIYPSSHDLETWLIVGRAIRAGRDFYCEALASGHPFAYPPLFAQTVLFPLALLIDPGNEFAFLFALRVIFAIFDLAIGAILWKMTRRKIILALWLFNPVALGASQTQFDCIPAFFMLLALLYLLKGEALTSSFLLGAGAALKIYPGVLFPICLKNLKRPGALFLALIAFLAVPLASSLSHLGSKCFLDSIMLHAGWSYPAMTMVRDFLFPIAYLALIVSAFKFKLSPTKFFVSTLTLFTISFSVFTSRPIQRATSVLPFLLLDMADGQSSAKCLIYNAVWVFASTFRYSRTLQKYLPMPFDLLALRDALFLAYIASLSLSFAIALLEGLLRARIHASPKAG